MKQLGYLCQPAGPGRAETSSLAPSTTMLTVQLRRDWCNTQLYTVVGGKLFRRGGEESLIRSLEILAVIALAHANSQKSFGAINKASKYESSTNKSNLTYLGWVPSLKRLFE